VRRQDWIIVAGILFLAAFMPMAIGGTWGVAYIVGETIVCLMLLVWAGEMRRAPAFPARAAVSKFALPIVALAGYVLVQLAPLPPPVLRVVSPRAYQLYARAFPDWPVDRPYAHLDAMVPATPLSTSGASPNSDFVVLPTLAEVKAGAPIPFAPKQSHSSPASIAGTRVRGAESGGLQSAVLKIYGTRWRPLTISPPQTWGALLMLATSAGLFLLVGFFPIGGGKAEAEALFRRVLAIALLAIGATVAAVGLIQQATWNGKILWFYVPLADLGAGYLGSPRACGPFVNPDHFAGYLAAIFPLALAGVLFPSAFISRKWSAACRIVCATLGFMIFVAVLASQSRAGWISIAVATTLVASLSMPSPATRPSHNIRSRYWRPARFALGTLTVMLVLATIFLGATGVSQTASRLHSTLSDVSDVAGRIDAWKAALRIIRDFWPSGIGLAAWPEIFAHYAPTPWSVNFFYKTENDYLQFIAETGVAGLLLAGWLAYLIVSRLKRGWPRMWSRTRSVEAALIAGVAVMAVVEFFDFDLQIPANAFTFAIILGLAVRLAAVDEEPGPGRQAEPAARHSMTAGWSAAAAIVLLIACLLQPRKPYPSNLTLPASLADARPMLLLYPANPLTHNLLLSFIGERMMPAARQREIQTAVWLDPTNPSPRDALAESLSDDGKVADALGEIKNSVFNSPAANTHQYLSERILPWLPPATQDAIELGYQRAVASNFAGALPNLALFYEQLGKYSEESALFGRAAGQTDDPEAKYLLLVEAGRSSALAGDFGNARMQLQMAAEIEPDDLASYQTLIAAVFAPTKDFDAMSRTIADATKNGADGYELWSTVASIAAEMGNLKVAEDAVNEALVYRPGSLRDLIRLGNLYVASGDADQAVRTLEKAVDMRGNSADAYFTLARAEEAAYEYADAEKAYSRAVDLAPQNASYKTGYEDFMKRMEKAAEQHASDPAR